MLSLLQNSTLFSNAGAISPSSITTASADVYIVMGQDAAVGPAAATIQQFVSDGGGLLIGAQAWYWSYSHPDVSQHPANLVLTNMGIVISSIVDMNSYTFTGSPPTQIGNVDVGIGCISDICTNVTTSSCYTSDETKLTNSMTGLADAAFYVPLDASFWTTLQQVRRVAKQPSGLVARW